MLISQDDVREFAELYKQEFGEEISVVEAREMATQLLRLYELITQLLPKETKIAKH